VFDESGGIGFGGRQRGLAICLQSLQLVLEVVYQ
jgi:hypothetical protein